MYDFNLHGFFPLFKNIDSIFSFPLVFSLVISLFNLEIYFYSFFLGSIWWWLRFWHFTYKIKYYIDRDWIIDRLLRINYKLTIILKPNLLINDSQAILQFLFFTMVIFLDNINWYYYCYRSTQIAFNLHWLYNIKLQANYCLTLKKLMNI